ncbi:MAG: hypothetical protein JRI23_27070 [Deltaproteobacteria bacterium]|nr:hypothetical protein [Deltaproteobacteria bacterium]MBW2535744.1 hypothetical protein [Deltaproteobacteria bacterium]
MRRLLPLPCATAVVVAAWLAPSSAHATEEQWRLGVDGTYAVAGLPEATAAGLGGGIHGTYGLTDAFNLRVNADVTAFPLPEPSRLAWMWNTTAGLEYVIDILDWVPILGLLAGPVGLYRQGDGQVVPDSHHTYFALEIPLGLGYQITPEFTLGLEGRYRMLLIGSDVGPINCLGTHLRAEYVWGE